MNTAPRARGELPLLGQGPAARVQAGTPSVLATGFRPFFLLAALFGALAVPSWVYIALQGAPLPSPFAGAFWHAHEMLYGYAAAVIAGFVLTAAQNWTGQPTARGYALLSLVLLWLVARVACAFGGAWPAPLLWPLALGFWPVLAFQLARPIARTRNYRNLAFPALVLALGGTDLAMHLGSRVPGHAVWLGRGLQLGLDLTVVLIVLMGGRIIAGFTRNALRSFEPRPRGALDHLGLGSVVLLALLDALGQGGVVLASACLLAGLVNLARLIGWGGLRTLGAPILWVLHLGWACTSASLVLRGAFLLWPPASVMLPQSLAAHTFTVGGLGLLTLGMMARVSLGHTGRPLVLARPVTLAIVLLSLAAAVRVVLPALWASSYAFSLVLSAALFSLALLLFLFVYGPILTRPRVDGRPG